MRIHLALFAFALMTMTGFRAQALGYACLSVDQDTRIDVVMNEVNVSAPAQRMIILDPTLSEEKQLTANFKLEEGFLSSEDFEVGHRFTAKVDPATFGSSRGGRHIGGTVLRALDTVVFEIQTVTQKQPLQTLAEGSMYAAQAMYIKKNGENLTQDFDCRLFLGDEAPPLDGE